MMNRKGWRKTWTIATFEFLTAVRRPGYLITTFGMPLFLAAYGGIVAIPAYFASRSVAEPSVYGIVDPGSVLRLEADVKSSDSQMPEEVKRALEATGQSGAVKHRVHGVELRVPALCLGSRRARGPRRRGRSRATSSSRPTTSAKGSSTSTRRTP